MCLDCICMCINKLELTENIHLHNSQQNSFSSMMLQGNDFCPLCNCMWVFRLELKENVDPYNSQESGFYSVTLQEIVCLYMHISICLFKLNPLKMLIHKLSKKLLPLLCFVSMSERCENADFLYSLFFLLLFEI